MCIWEEGHGKSKRHLDNINNPVIMQRALNKYNRDNINSKLRLLSPKPIPVKRLTEEQKKEGNDIHDMLEIIMIGVGNDVINPMEYVDKALTWLEQFEDKLREETWAYRLLQKKHLIRRQIQDENRCTDIDEIRHAIHELTDPAKYYHKTEDDVWK